MPAREFADLDQLRALVGQEVAVGDWFPIEQTRIDRLIAAGTIARWFAYLRDCRRRLELAAPDADPATVARLAAVLREQYLLVPALRLDEPDDEPEQRRLEELAWTSH